MNRIYLLLFILLPALFSPKAVAQKLSAEQTTLFQRTEDSLVVLADSMYSAFIPEERLEHCYKFVKQLSHLLKNENSFYYPFEKLGQRITIIYPDNKAFRVFNWGVRHQATKTRYYGAIQVSGSINKLYPLLDQSENLDDNTSYGLLNNKKWYGCQYYRILTEKNADGNPIYFALGLNNNSTGYTTKLIDVINLMPNEVIFGGDYFKTNPNLTGPQRFIIQYQKGAQVSLNFDKDKNMITYDKLVSEINQPERKNTLVPSGSIDGFLWRNNSWQPVQNVIPIMKLKDGQAPVNGVIPN